MSTKDKIENKAEELKGRGKEAVGAATDDSSLRGEGTMDQMRAHAKQAGEKVKDAGEEVKDAAGKVKDALTR